MLEIIVGIFTIYTVLRVYVAVMQIGFISDQKQLAPVLMNRERYVTAGNYAIARQRLSLIEILLEYLLFLGWAFVGFAWLQGFFGPNDTVLSAVAFLFGFFAINFLVGLPLDIYGKFVVDDRFGFNKATPKMYLIDTIKSIILFALFGGAVLALLAWIIAGFASWWIWGFVLVFVVVILANLLMPFFMSLFNSFDPMEEGELKTSIEAMMTQAGLKSDGIFVMDASKRDSRLNAFFGGLGKSKRVVLFDTLMEKLETKELLAVLGHELGHFAHGDIWKNIGMVGVMLLTGFFLFGNMPDELFTAMGMVPTSGAKIALLILLLPVLSFVFTPIMSYVSQHNEYAADAYGSEMGGKENLVSALLKLVTENKSFPKSHPLVIFFYYTHPPILERLEELGCDTSRVNLDEGQYR